MSKSFCNVQEFFFSVFLQNIYFYIFLQLICTGKHNFCVLSHNSLFHFALFRILCSLRRVVLKFIWKWFSRLKGAKNGIVMKV